MRSYRQGVRFQHDPSGDSSTDPSGGGAPVQAPDISQQAEDLKRREADLERREEQLSKDAEYLQSIEPFIDEEVRDLIRRKQSGEPAPREPETPQPSGQSAADILAQVTRRAIDRGADPKTAQAITEEIGGLLNTAFGGLRQQHMHELAELTKKIEDNLGSRLGPIESSSALDRYVMSGGDVVKGVPKERLLAHRGEIMGFAAKFAQKPKSAKDWETVVHAWMAPKLAESGGLDFLAEQADLGERTARVITPGPTGMPRPDMPTSRKREKGERKVWGKEMGHSAVSHGFKDLDHLNDVLEAGYRTFRRQ